jgi:polysaccharide export outer membrane protein
VLGVGDVIRVTVYDHPDLAIESQIGAGGQVSFPLVGDVSLKNMTASQAEKYIATRLVEGKFLREAHVNVLVSQYKSLSVSVLGEVNRPGKYALEGKTSLLEVLALAGGISGNGGTQLVLMRNLLRPTPERFEYQLDDLMTVNTGKKPQPALLSGDVIFVPKAEKFYIYGEVQRPGNYRLESQMTAMQALAAGGGFTQRANKSNLRLSRKNGDGSLQESSINMSDELKDGDVIFVKESLF